MKATTIPLALASQRYVLMRASLLLISNCQDMGVDPEGPGKIWPGVSVEGIRLGDSKETVKAILGESTSEGQHRKRIFHGVLHPYTGRSSQSMPVKG
ncbi:hypothetical protein EHM92_01640 [bacterium]|nr:MAG: hypothetical protein EHM92_01640 [bacterium]